MCDITNKIQLAKQSIILIDDFVDESTITILSKKSPEVSVKIISRNRLMTHERNVKRRKVFRGGFSFYETNLFKNRYLLVDEKFLFLMSRPLRFNSKRNFYFVRIIDKEQVMNMNKRIEECQMAKKTSRHF